jgi:hypothetical protein
MYGNLGEEWFGAQFLENTILIQEQECGNMKQIFRVNEN